MFKANYIRILYSILYSENMCVIFGLRCINSEVYETNMVCDSKKPKTGLFFNIFGR